MTVIQFGLLGIGSQMTIQQPELRLLQDIAGHLRLFKSIQQPGAMIAISPCHFFPHEGQVQHPPGPHQVMWFVSHFWGTSFRHFVQSVRKHAESVAPYSSLGRPGDAPRGLPGAAAWSGPKCDCPALGNTKIETTNCQRIFIEMINLSNVKSASHNTKFSNDSIVKSDGS